MNNKPKSIDISGVKYAMSSEIGESHTFLERLAAAGKIGKVNWNGNNYYEVDKAKKIGAELRTIPPGYVRAVDHAILLGSDSRTVSEMCNTTGAPAKKVLVNGTKPAWFCDKAWLEKKLGKTLTPKPTIKAKSAATPTAVNNVTTIPSLAELQSAIQELRGVIQSLTRGRVTPQVEAVTEEIARERGYRPLQDLAKELEVAHGTLLGWKNRGQVRFYKVSGRVFLNVEDVERMYVKLDDNRAIVTSRMGARTNNSLTPPNGVS